MESDVQWPKEKNNMTLCNSLHTTLRLTKFTDKMQKKNVSYRIIGNDIDKYRPKQRKKDNIIEDASTTQY